MRQEARGIDPTEHSERSSWAVWLEAHPPFLRLAQGKDASNLRERVKQFWKPGEARGQLKHKVPEAAKLGLRDDPRFERHLDATRPSFVIEVAHPSRIAKPLEPLDALAEFARGHPPQGLRELVIRKVVHECSVENRRFRVTRKA